jgi:Holliday junction resolvase
LTARAKGQRTERKAVEELEKQGYLVYRVKGSTKFNKDVDIFSLFDILCVKPNESRLIQVKTNQKPPLEPYNKFSQTYPQFKCEVWVWKDRRGFDIYGC